MKVRKAGVLLALGLFACDADPGQRSGTEAEDAPGAGKADDGAAPAGAGVDPGALTWSQLQTPTVGFDGGPLFVSNNPEVVNGYGVLAASQGGSPIGWGQRSDEAPAGTWNGENGSSQCEEGYTDFGVYLAHIRGSNVSSAAFSLVLEAPQGANVTVWGEVGTTDWSDSGGYKTIRESWLSAAIADAFFYGSPSQRTYTLQPGQPTVVAEQTARSLVEGRLQVSADACVKALVVASPPGRATDYLNRAAEGDVKWPGWYQGIGHGRAAGMFGQDGVQARSTLTFRSHGAQGVGLLRPEESIVATGRPSDSAEILFGNYGALIDVDVQLINETGACSDVLVEMVSYIDKGGTADRTPTQSFFDRTGWSDPPTMFWNGPVRTDIDGSVSQGHAVLRAAPTSAERSNPSLPMQSMRETLGSVRMLDGDVSDVSVQFPVPGYIVAPLAITATARPCG